MGHFTKTGSTPIKTGVQTGSTTSSRITTGVKIYIPNNRPHSIIPFTGGLVILFYLIFWGSEGPANRSIGLEQGPFDPKIALSRALETTP